MRCLAGFRVNDNHGAPDQGGHVPAPQPAVEDHRRAAGRRLPAGQPDGLHGPRGARLPPRRRRRGGDAFRRGRRPAHHARRPLLSRARRRPERRPRAAAADDRPDRAAARDARRTRRRPRAAAGVGRAGAGDPGGLPRRRAGRARVDRRRAGRLRRSHGLVVHGLQRRVRGVPGAHRRYAVPALPRRAAALLLARELPVRPPPRRTTAPWRTRCAGKAPTACPSTTSRSTGAASAPAGGGAETGWPAAFRLPARGARPQARGGRRPSLHLPLDVGRLPRHQPVRHQRVRGR